MPDSRSRRIIARLLVTALLLAMIGPAATLGAAPARPDNLAAARIDAPANLVAMPGNGIVWLSWSGVGGASGYTIYRSQASGDGYLQIDSSAATSFADLTVTNGQRYYYVVTAYAGANIESPPSNEAAATPSFPIGYAVLQFPKSIVHTVGVTPTQQIYGQVFAGGITDSGGAPAQITAQVGFGPQGSNPATWSGWRPMSFNLANGNNYEYAGTLRPDQAGNFDMLVRFSTDGGLTWTYGDKDGFFPGEPGTDAPGDLAVVANADTDPPAAPADLRVDDWSQNFIALSWQPVADAALYQIYRSTITDTYDLNTPLAEIAAPATDYTDTTVSSGVRYHYIVKAADHALNPSPPSNEVSQVAQPRLVAVTFNVSVPPGTPGTPTIAGNNAQVFGAAWNAGSAPLTQVGPHAWRYQATVLHGTLLQYKYARGSWETVEKDADGNTDVSDRQLIVDYGAAGTMVITDTVANWRDPFVIGQWPAAGATGISVTAAVSVTWNQAMPPTAAFTVADAGGLVSGSVAYDSATRATTWTPAAPLVIGGTYTVTVAGQQDVNGDNQRVSSVWSFQTVPVQRSFGLSPGAAGSGAAGGQIAYTLTITNTGNVADSYAITQTGGLWPAAFPASVGPLAPGQSATIQVAVSIPGGAANGASDSLTLAARSQSLSSLVQSIQFTTRSATWRAFLPLLQRAP